MSIRQAKTQFSQVVDKAVERAEILIARAGRPVAMLVPRFEAHRTPGGWEGRVVIREHFDELPAEVAAMLDGRRS